MESKQSRETATAAPIPCDVPLPAFGVPQSLSPLTSFGGPLLPPRPPFPVLGSPRITPHLGLPCNTLPSFETPPFLPPKIPLSLLGFAGTELRPPKLLSPLNFLLGDFLPTPQNNAQVPQNNFIHSPVPSMPLPHPTGASRCHLSPPGVPPSCPALLPLFTALGCGTDWIQRGAPRGARGGAWGHQLCVTLSCPFVLPL